MQNQEFTQVPKVVFSIHSGTQNCMHIATHNPGLIAKHDKAFLFGRTARRFFIVGICLASSACSTPPNAPPPPRIVGNDADVHGCRASAGFVWNAAQQQCVRPWLQPSPKAE